MARRVGMHRLSVNRWAWTLVEEGRRGLKKTERAGRKPQLSATDVRKLKRALVRGPITYGYETGLWTLARVAAVIKMEWVRFHLGRRCIRRNARHVLMLPACLVT